MIRIGYDVTALAHSAHGGIAQVCLHTLRQAGRNPDLDAHGYYRSGRPSEELISELSLKKMSLGDRWWGRSFDIVHGLCHRLPRLRGHRSVYTLYDVWSLYPNRYQSPSFQKKIGARMRRELTSVDFVVTNSETTRTNLLELDLVPPEKVGVSHLGVETSFDNDDPPVPPALTELVTTRYVLFVGRLEYRKNLGHVVDAVASLAGVNLVLVGQPGYGYEDHVSLHLSKFDGARLHLFSKVTYAELAILYRHAVATLLPSWEEGFGLPILEAMSHGSPVITSNCSAAAEVAAEAAVLVDPDDPVAGCEAVQRLLEDPPYRDMLIQAGLARAASFTWELYFERLVTIYRQLLDG